MSRSSHRNRHLPPPRSRRQQLAPPPANWNRSPFILAGNSHSFVTDKCQEDGM
ncbi:hypothetical protein BC826DRAFT_1052855 [Russula brevipes]|nr:hypothetical protein BC826DRAFT_1058789 [Russula brevipes]KAI0285156.1 hypothetical protein BC826DRAFT_1052855 [Russula brevipes]